MITEKGGHVAGRPAVTSRADLEHAALGLFAAHGFDATTVDDIAAAAGIGRRTFFRYYASKNDVVWGDFEQGLAHLHADLARADPSLPLLDTLRTAVLTFNAYAPSELPWHRDRMRLILEVPALQAHATLRYAAWRAVIAEHAARVLGVDEQALLPRLIGHLCLGAAVSAYEQWLAEPDADLEPLLDQALRALDGAWTT